MPRRPIMALLVVDLEAPASANQEVSDLLQRVAQLIRFTNEPGDIKVGGADSICIPDMTRAEFIAALSTLKKD